MSNGVPSTVKAISETVGRFYTHFLLRDVVYLVAGGQVLTASVFATHGELPHSELSFMFGVGYLLASYFLGHLVQYAALILHLVEDQPINLKEYGNPIAVTKALFGIIGEDGVREYERIVFQKHIGAAIGPSCLICYIIFAFQLCMVGQPKLFHFVALLYFSLSTPLCLALNGQMLRLQNRIFWTYLVKQKRAALQLTPKKHATRTSVKVK
jgi:hypothetical protein